MKKGKWIMAFAVAGGAAGLAYALWPKSKIPDSAIFEPFDKEKYMGTWYEVARLPNRIEQNLQDLTEDYSLNEDGTIQVITRAYHAEKKKPVEATGRIKFKGAESRGKLEVAYYLPIYLDYYVLDVDDDYRYAMVSGNGLGYLWLLSRENSIPDEMKIRFLEKAAALGFETWALEWM